MEWGCFFFLTLLATTLARFAVDCGPRPAPPTVLDSITAPIRNSVSEFWHVVPNGTVSRSPAENGIFNGSLHISTWPSFGNATHTFLEGFSYAVPPGISRLSRYQVLARLMDLTWGRIEHTIIEAFYHQDKKATYTFNGVPLMPEEFLSWSAAGAHLSVTTPDNGTLQLTDPTNEYGHFEEFIQHDRPSFSEPKQECQTLDIKIDSCNALDPLEHDSHKFSAHDLPPQGITIVSDIDDILRNTESWNPKQMVINLFVRQFKPWRSMPKVFWNWHEAAKDDIHFHYATDTPETAYRSYTDGIPRYYPEGSYHFRPLTFSSWSQFANARFENIKKLIETFPERQYILVGTTSSSTAISTYVKLAETFPNQIKCIVLRDAAETEPAMWMKPNAKALKRIDKHVLFVEPDDLNGTALLKDMVADPANPANVDCRSLLRRPENKVKFSYDGFLTSWLKTLWALEEGMFSCVLALHQRPSRLCVFDRRPGTDYYWGGPPENKSTDWWW